MQKSAETSKRSFNAFVAFIQLCPCILSHTCCLLYWTPLKYHDTENMSIAMSKNFTLFYFVQYIEQYVLL